MHPNPTTRPTVLSVRPNPLTGSHEAEVVATVDRHGKPLRNVCWLDSGMIGVDPIPMENVDEFYRSQYRQQYKGAFSPQMRHVLRAARCAAERFRRIRVELPVSAQPGQFRTLDVGSSSGEFVYLMRKLGFEAHGVEPHVGYASYARQTLGLEIANCGFSEYRTPEKGFGLVTVFHVLEHLEFPVEDLSRLALSLAEDGILAIEVPNILYPGMRFCRKWHKAHLSGFTSRTLEAVAARAGLRPVFCGEIGDGGNLMGIFRRGPRADSRELAGRLADHPQEVRQAFEANSDLAYHSRADTWRKVPGKFFSQIEERLTAQRYGRGAALLDAVYGEAFSGEGFPEARPESGEKAHKTPESAPECAAATSGRAPRPQALHPRA